MIVPSPIRDFFLKLIFISVFGIIIYLFLSPNKDWISKKFGGTEEQIDKVIMVLSFILSAIILFQ